MLRHRSAFLARFAALLAVAAACSLGCDSDSDTGGGTNERAVAGVVVVTTAGAGDQDGSTWANAYAGLQAALAAASSDSTITEIWVASGTYLPTTGSDRTATFQLLANVAIYGGFTGDETARTDRDHDANPTILSGDIGTGGDATDNVYHVVTGATDAIIDGFVISDGYAVLGVGEMLTDDDNADITTADPDAEILRIVEGVKKVAGGGMLNLQVAPTVRNCTFRDNSASKGGAVYNMVSDEFPEPDTHAAPRFENCRFETNTASARGGAINNDFKTHPTLIDVVFQTNSCTDKGGAIYNDFNCSPTIVNGLFTGNSAERGGAMVNDGTSSPLLAYCTFAGNTATDIGGALYQGTYGAMGVASQDSTANHPQLVECILVGNSSGNSTSSISNWHDDSLVTSGGTIETVDGTITQSTLLNGDYSPVNTSEGWMDGRGLDENDITPLTNPTYPGYDYSTSSTPGPGVMKVGAGWPAPDHTTLEAALAVVTGGTEIWLAQGTYYPTTGADRTATFVIPNGVSVYGGFDGSESVRADRDPAVNITILSGDIGVGGDDSDNSYHVVVPGMTTVIDGVTITAGNADGEWHHARGGGVLGYIGVSFSLTDCIIDDNAAIEGGGLAAYDDVIPTLDTVTFSNNSATIGAAMLLRDGSDASMTDCVFSGNTASDRGGAVYIDYGASPTCSGNSFTGNAASASGGAIYMDDNASQIGATDATFNGDTFTSNSAQARGGAVMLYNTRCSATFTTAAFNSNSAQTGGGAAAVDFLAEGTFTGCSFSGNTSTSGNADVDSDGGTVTIN